MSLTDAISWAMEEFNKRKNKLGVWETLEKKLKKAGFEDQYKEIIKKVDSLGAYKFLKVWDIINENLNKKQYRWSNKKEVFEVIKMLSEIDNVEEIIKTIAETGYKLHYHGSDIPWSYLVYLSQRDFKIFETLAKDDLYKKYGLVFKALEKLGYKKIDSYGYEKSMLTQLDCLINIASFEGDAVGAIYVLANNSYKIDELTGINKSDSYIIKKIAEEDEKDRSEGKEGVPVYLYNTGKLELFQGYFTSLKIEDKKLVLKSILECETEQEFRGHNKIRDWLEKDYERLIREVGFED